LARAEIGDGYLFAHDANGMIGNILRMH
jgi:hypothetical protein